MVMLDPKRSRAYMKRAGLTTTMINQTIGKITIDRMSAQASGLSKSAVEGARSGIQNSMVACTTISAMYNSLRETAQRDPREIVDRAELAADTAILEQLFAKEYRLTDPAGNVGDRQKSIDAILSGKIQKRTFGRGGFESTESVLQIHGTTATLTGEFKMRATQLARNKKTRAVERLARDGTFRSMHTYVFRDDRWQLAASQLTQTTEPTLPSDWVFVND